MLKRASEFIVDRRVVLFALFAVLVVYSALPIGRVSQGGALVDAAYRRDGRYIVFGLEDGGDFTFAPAHRAPNWALLIPVAAAVAAAAAVAFARKRKAKPREDAS